MQRPTLPHSKRRLVSLSSIAGGLIAIIVAGAVVTTGSAAGKPTPTASPSPSATVAAPTATPSPAVSPTPVTLAKPAPPPPVEQPKQLPIGRIDADRVRVHTGDGDCLNIRGAPTTTGDDTQVIYCATEGTYLWLYGDAKQADGESWRRALGSGWVATRYTQPAPLTVAEQALPGGLSGGEVFGAQPTAALVTIGRDGAVSPAKSLPAARDGAMLSPDGKLLAVYDGNGTRIIDATGADVLRIPSGTPIAWSDSGRLLLRSQQQSCNPECLETYSVFDPATHSVTTTMTGPVVSGGAAWNFDGMSILAAPRGKQLVHIGEAGTVTSIIPSLPDGVSLYDFSASPDGKSLLTGGGFLPLRIIDLQSGTVRDAPRAKARILTGGGGCGAGIGRLTAWAGNGAIVYHEALSTRGDNGLTIANLADGTRRVLPIITISDVRAVNAKVVSFTTWESTDTQSFQLVWLLDVQSGEARPIAVGSTASWQ